jgi:pyridoxine 5-phosphate synthase
MAVKLGVNIDHIATIREARKIRGPDPVAAAVLAELAGCHGITAHLREDRRHIQDRDIRLLRGMVTTHLNMEMAPSPEMVQFALDLHPDMATLVPENRLEITTEGGLNVAAKAEELSQAIAKLKQNDILVSVFIDPESSQVKAAKKVGADFVEFHTGKYSNAYDMGDSREVESELSAIQDMTLLAHKYGLRINAGHGLNYRNVGPIAAIPHIEELNIGHSIIGRAALVGMERAVKEMLEAIRRADS